MIYKYKCVDCGLEHDGAKICFALTKMLGIEGIDPRLSMVSFKELDRWAGSENDLYQGKRCRIRLTLKDFMKVLGRNFVKNSSGGTLDASALKLKSERFEKDMESLKYSDLGSENGLGRLVLGTMSQAERRQELKVCEQAIQSSFLPQFEQEENSEGDVSRQEMSENIENYCAFLWIEAILFEGEKEVYSLRYSTEEKPANMRELAEPQNIRGYCPVCGAPVILGTGKYPHRLVGMIGARSAGKTSIMISLIDEIAKRADKYGMAYQEEDYLCDSRYYVTGWNIKLFRNGWAVRKTPADVAGGNTFNVSVLLESGSDRTKKQVVTFVDIAGELCYDQEKRTWDPDAPNKFPLITKCDIYLLCTCINEDSYIIDDQSGANSKLDSDAVMKIVKGMYHWIEKDAVERLRAIPPLCIIVTQADLKEERVFAGNETVFDEILNSKESFCHREEVGRLKDYYMTTQSESFKNPLVWCVKVYNDMKDSTYVSMMPCSALGGERSQYKVLGEETEASAASKSLKINKKPQVSETTGRTGNELLSLAERKKRQEEYQRQYSRSVVPNPEPCGTPFGMDVLWNWLLSVLGFRSVLIGGKVNPDILPEREYRLSQIPSFDDYYRTGRQRERTCRQVFDITEAMDRIQAVDWLFLNCSERDREIYDEYISVGNRGLLLFRKKKLLEKRIEAIREIANSWN